MIAPMAEHPFAPGFVRTDGPWGRGFRCLHLPFDHLFATRDANVRESSPDSSRAWDALGVSLGIPGDRVVRAAQVHGNAVLVVRAGEAAAHDSLPEVDILVSNDTMRALCVKVADCTPLLIGDPVTGAVAAAHAGWRGTLARVAEVAVSALARHFGARPANLVAAIGPCIGAPAYEVGEGVRDEFVSAGHAARSLERWFPRLNGGPPHLDLWQANADQLVAAGVPEPRIHCLRGCTRSHPAWFFSHRGEGAETGRMVAAIRAGAVE
jgi:YfiH family protein